MGTFNSTSQHYCGHFNIWITNEIQELLVYLEEFFTNVPATTGWVNGNLYTATKEMAGVLLISPNIHELSGMAGYEPTLDSQQSYGFLANLQGTRKPILPVHSPNERQLFQKLLHKNNAFNSPSGPNWKQAVKVWNHIANRTNNIFYKVCRVLLYF